MKQHFKLLKSFHHKLVEKGYMGKIISSKYLDDLQNDIIKYEKSKDLDLDFIESYAKYLKFKPEAPFPIKSIFIIAIPDPIRTISFIFNDEEIKLKIPPTYLFGDKLIKKVKKLLEELLIPNGYSISYAFLPVKTLAVRSGLAKYGRNNITYISKRGSFYRLMSFYSDFPISSGGWHDPEMMDACKKCSLCVNSCPTKAISQERFLLYVKRCITYWNEQTKNIPFPEWIDKSWHNCLIGCLICQKVCPVNKKYLDFIKEGPKFDKSETQALMKLENLEELPANLKDKLKREDLSFIIDILPRNLKVFSQKD